MLSFVVMLVIQVLLSLYRPNELSQCPGLRTTPAGLAALNRGCDPEIVGSASELIAVIIRRVFAVESDLGVVSVIWRSSDNENEQSTKPATTIGSTSDVWGFDTVWKRCYCSVYTCVFTTRLRQADIDAEAAGRLAQKSGKGR